MARGFTHVRLVLWAALLATAIISPANAAVIDFEDFDLGGMSYLDVGSPLTFPDVDGSGVTVSIVQGADNRIYDLYLFGGWVGQALIDWPWGGAMSNPAGTTILFDQDVSNFILEAGDFGSDDDSPLSITAYDADDNVIGSDSVPWDASKNPPFATLSLNVSGIRKIVYHSGGNYANSTFIDNLTFTTSDLFELLSPANGSGILSAPSFSWSSGGFDAFLFISVFYYDLGYWSGYYPVKFWLLDPGFAMPSTWWDKIGQDTPCYWAVLGVNTSTLEWEVAGPWSFSCNKTTMKRFEGGGAPGPGKPH